MSNYLVQTLRFLGVLFLILFFVVHALFLRLIYRDLWTFRKKINFVKKKYTNRVLRILNVKLSVVGQKNQSPTFFVSNHHSYLDALIYISLLNSCFVTSHEMRETPGLGLLLEAGGCLFVERRNRQNLLSEIKDVSSALKCGLSVVVFPEATSTNAEMLLRFRKPLYQAAIDAGVKIQPLCLTYLRVGQTRFNLQNRDTICWYGKMTFLPHLWNLSGVGRIEAKVDFLETLDTNLTSNCAYLAETSYQKISTVFLPVTI